MKKVFLNQWMVIIVALLIAGVSKLAAEDATDQPTPELSKITWGGPASGLKAGVNLAKISSSDATRGYTCMVYVQSEASRTLALPVKSQSLDVRLIDFKGKEVKRGKAGRAVGDKLQIDKELQDVAKSTPGSAYISQSRAFPLEAAQPTKVEYFRVMDYFKVAEPGEYRLVVEVRFIERHADGSYALIQLPPITEKVKIETQDLE